MSAEPNKSSYDVGYGKPPANHQWKPGESGNPKGRPKKKVMPKSIPEYIAEALTETVNLKIDGSVKTVPMSKGLAKSLVRDLMTSSPKDKIKLLEMMEKLGVFQLLQNMAEDASRDEPAIGCLSEEEKELLAIARRDVGLDPPEGWDFDEDWDGRYDDLDDNDDFGVDHEDDQDPD
ncbi:MAG: hypothetical protein KDE49_03335 [Novosphingobium sp.]|nr:hypothetical protein [Novosphingobium sp.]